MTICFVVLHYLAFHDTLECVSSIDKLYNDYDKKIVIIDNCSWNGTGEQLQKVYNEREDIKVILLEENLGFARGNNAGYAFAKEQYNPDFIIVINNDVVFFQQSFLDVMKKLYETENYDVLGPDVLDLTRTIHTSPIATSLRTVKMYKHSIKKLEVSVKAMEYGGIWEIQEKILDAISILKQRITGKGSPKTRDNVKCYQCVLQGACFIFSPKFIQNHNEAFCPETFLYHEEHILLYTVKRDGGIVLYSPEIQLIHKEDCATNMEQKADSIEKRIFKFKEEIKSRRILLRMMEEDAEK